MIGAARCLENEHKKANAIDLIETRRVKHSFEWVLKLNLGWAAEFVYKRF